MVEYLTLFFVLLIASIAFYLAYDRYFRKEAKSDSALYVEALRDLLDGRPESAFGKLRQVVVSDADNIDAYMRLGQILREHKKPDRALQVHKDLTLRRDLTTENKVAILKHLVLDYADLGERDTAEAALRELTSLQPDSHWAFSQLLRIQRDAGKWSEAYDTAAKLLKLENSKSKRPLAYFKYRMGVQLFEKLEYHKARVLFKEAIGLNPEFTPAYVAIGDSYCEEKRFEDAVNFWKKLIDAVPSEGHQVIDRLKRTLFDLGRFGDIADICESILAVAPKDVPARLTLAEFHTKKGDLDRSEEILLQLVEDNPDDTGAILELVRLYAERDDRKRLSAFIRQLGQKQEKKNGKPLGGIVDGSLIGIN